MSQKKSTILILLLLQMHAFFAHNNNACVTPLNDIGQCVSLQYCPEVPLFFTTLPRTQAIEYSRVLQKICHHHPTYDRYPMVCCTKPKFKQMQRVNFEIVPIYIVDEVTSTESELQETSTQNSKILTNNESNKTCVSIENELGICKPLQNCSALLKNLLKDPNNESFKAHLRALHEVCDSTTTEVCCPDVVIQPTPTTRIPTTAPLRNGTKVRLPTEDEGCGRDQHTVFTKVVGGHDSQVGAWPWIALLGYDPYSSTVFRCGGTLISARHVLSAAHCILPQLSFVRLGEYDLSVENDANHVDINIEKAVRHENYGHNKMMFDLALLYLEKNVQFTAFIYPICLPISSQLRSKSFVSYTPFAAGWGRTTENGDSSNILQEVQLLVHENHVCRDAFRNVLRSKGRLLTDDHFDKSVLCAGDLAGEKDTCKGDSGGPLMAPEQYKGRTHYYLIGVVSYGIGCAKKGVPAIYTSTQYFMDWIMQKIEES